jgi:TolB-like protein/DNA-binding winged helix-turn-helix (wHTH) protein/Tfp pilus assembly protein PilF
MEIWAKGTLLAEVQPRIFRFEDFELDCARFELRRGGVRVHAEPQVLSLLILLAQNAARMVGKDEIIDKIWDGRIVSESAVAARVKAARKAIGDDGKSQRLIRTIHSKGFRFVGNLAEAGAALRPIPPWPDPVSASSFTTRDGRPSIAVLPFELVGEAGPLGIIADALPADIIMDLSRLHWLFVIARGSSFRFRGNEADPLVVARALAVRYCLTGTIEVSGENVTVAVILADGEHGETIWAEHYRGSLAEIQMMRPEIEAHVVAALEAHIPRNEVRIARRRPATELDAWASFHLGLDHMYRFRQADNAAAAELFAQSLACDPHFSRALGGLSFTHFQNAFLNFGGSPGSEIEAASTFAYRALEADQYDPFAHFNVGRSFWLDGQLGDAIAWLDTAISLSPSYAQGIYNRGLVSTMAGRPEDADADLTLALDLSPLDPLAYAMVSSRAMAHVQLGDYEAAADFGSRAARMPGAHKHIALIAAFTAQLAGNLKEASAWLAKVKVADPDITAETFFHAFPFAHNPSREVIEKSIADLRM